MDTYDFVVLGSGAGLNVLDVGLNEGLKCVLVENTKIGGTCLTRGCIPSKVLIHPADIIREAQRAKKVGLTFKLESVDWDLISKRMWSQIDESKEMEKGLLHAHNLKLYKGTAEFSGEYELIVKLNDEKKAIGPFKGKRFLISTGTRTLLPLINGIEDVGYVTNETFFGEKFPKKPYKSLIIIGGSIIAAEFAHLFSALGTEVTVVEMLPRLITTEEPEVSALLETNFKKFMKVLLNFKAIKAQMKKGMKSIAIKHTQTGEEKELEAEEILIATGRKSNADLLKVEKTGVEIDSRGWIKTNQYLETSKKNIWCIGDANGLFQFRHKANYEAEIVTSNIFGNENHKHAVDYSSVPWAIFTYPEIGHVGMTQAEAIEKGYEIFVATKTYSSVAKGFAMGYDKGDDDDGFVKLIIDKSYKILGAHIIGPQASVLVQPFVYLMNAGFSCSGGLQKKTGDIPKMANSCPEGGSFMPIYHSMVIHPSLNEVTGWAIGNMKPINIKMEHHHHHDQDHK